MSVGVGVDRGWREREKEGGRVKAGVKRESLNGVKVDCLLLAVKVIHSFTMLGNWFRVTVDLDFQRFLHWSGTRTYLPIRRSSLTSLRRSAP